MPIPDFVLSIREGIGTSLLPMVGVTAVVFDDTGRVLLGQRSDNGAWALPSGILEPGEQPAPGLAREVLEETCVRVTVDALVSVCAQPEVTYANGDRAQYLDLCFLCSYVDGEAAVGDDESLDVGWFTPDDLPAGFAQRSADRLRQATAYAGTTWFEPS